MHKCIIVNHEDIPDLVLFDYQSKTGMINSIKRQATK